MSPPAAQIPPLCFACRMRHEKYRPCPDGTRWWSGTVECRVCTDRHAAVIPLPAGIDAPGDSECPRCGALACEPVDP